MLTPLQISNATNRCLQRLADIGKDMVRKEKHGEVVNELYDEARYLSTAYKVLNSNHGLDGNEIQKIVECMTKKGNLNKNYSVVSITLATNSYLATQGYITSLTLNDSSDIDFTQSGTTAIVATATLVATGVTAGSGYNTFTVDSKGRITAASTTSYLASGSTAGGALAGTYPNPTIANITATYVAFGHSTAGRLDSDSKFQYDKTNSKLVIGRAGAHVSHQTTLWAYSSTDTNTSNAFRALDSSGNIIFKVVGDKTSSFTYGGLAIGDTAAGTDTGIYVSYATQFQYGIRINETKVNATNNYGLKIEPATTSGTNYFGTHIDIGSGATNIYSLVTGTNGLIGFGTLTPTARVEIRGTGTGSGTLAFYIRNNTPADLLKLTDNGRFSVGLNSSAGGNGCLAIGNSANASDTSGNGSISIGASSTASGNASIAIGGSSNSTQISSVALGYAASATGGSGATALGNASVASNDSALAIINGATASGNASIAIGKNALASGAQSIAIGVAANATATHNIMIGAGVDASTPIVNGTLKTVAIGTFSDVPTLWITGGDGTSGSIGNVVLANAAISTTATNGFLYITGCAGTPTGVPTTYTGRVPLVADTTNNKIYAYLGGAWTALN